ncbi:MAG: murein biosynthesis integral membrane protein MurJ [Salibacteraceae bacterium]
MASSDSNSIFKKFIGDSGLILAMSVGSRGMLLIKEIVIASLIGLNADLDAFYLAILIPGYLVVSLTNPLGPVFIAELNSKSANQDIFINRILTYLFLGLTAVSVLYYGVIPLFEKAYSITPEQGDLFRTISVIYIPVIVIQGISNYLLAYLENQRHFFLTSLGAIIQSLTILLFVYLNAEVLSLGLGMLVGIMLFLIVQLIIIKKGGKVKLKFSLKGESFSVKFKKEYLWLFLASFSMGATLVVDQYMASYFDSSSVSALNYGYKIATMLAGVGALALGAVSMPYFSQLMVSNAVVEVRLVLKKILILIFAIGLPVVALVYFYSDLIISLVFERGKFSMQNVTLVAAFLSWYILQLPFYIGGVVLSRLLSAMNKTKVLFLFSFCGLSLNIILNLVFTQIWGVAGIALSTSCVYGFTFVSLLIVSLYYLQILIKSINTAN